MNLADMKKYYENGFNNNWTDTPIHFSGQEFEGKDVPKWVSPHFTPNSGEKVGFDGMLNQSANLYVSCWADTELDAMVTADSISTFVNSMNTDTIRVNGYEVADHSYHPSNKFIIIMAYRVEYVSDC